MPQVAPAYKLAADELLKQALEKYEPHELDYPVLFHYRHTVQVYLKAALDAPPEYHDLSTLIQLLEAESGKKITRWVKDRLWDFHPIDNMAALFRYADPVECFAFYAPSNRGIGGREIEGSPTARS